MGELLSEIGDLVFSLVISYIGAIEFLYVVRHLYHWSFNHDTAENTNDDERLAHLQDKMREQLANAKSKEDKAGNNVMKDGVQYKDGFRLDPILAEINSLREQLQDKALNALKRQELEKELAKLQKLAEQIRKELEKAEAAKRKEEEDNARKLIEAEQKREREQRKLEEERAAAKQKEAEENARKLAELEKQKEQEQRRKEEEEQAKKEAEENARQLIEAEKRREAEQRRREEEQAQREAEENALKLVEAQIQREQEQRKKEQEEEQAQKEAEENARQLMEAEKQREEEQRRKEEEEQAQREAEENVRKLEELEKQREQEQRRKELEEEELHTDIEKANEEQLAAEQDEENARKFLEIEHKLEEQLRAAELETDLTEKERQLIESIKRRDISEEDHNEQKEEELLRRILEAREQLAEDSEDEQSLRLIEREKDQEGKQRRIEENALLFLEAEKEMEEIQKQMQEGVEKRIYGSNLESAPQTPILEEPCVKKLIAPLLEDENVQPINQRVKTQLAQDLNESYSVSSRPLLFPGVSDEGSSLEPLSSQQSSISTHPSEDLTTGNESQYPPQQDRQEPDGEDTTPSLQYTEDYLRSLDGIKQRPLVRDGSGRRRAFKKRRSSNSSNSSRESRTSRDEELKMFTSLEEEEMKTTGESEFTPIRYTSEPTLKVKGHHRRHKRSPAKDMKSDESLRSSLERLGEETSDPWGEAQPEHYKDSDFWKREKALSIDEEMEFERPASSEEIAYDTATYMPSASSFEEATQIQNEQALTALRQQASKEPRTEELDEKAIFVDESGKSDNKTNLQTSQISDREASPARSSSSPRLRRSPRIEEIDQYEERWKENHDEIASPSQTSSINTPSITVQSPLDFGSWRDEHGLMMQGLSDFYDFSASVNPSRSRNTSRNASPANTAPNTPQPKNVAFDLEISGSGQSLENTVEIYDDTGDCEKNEFRKENIIKFIDSLDGSASNVVEVEYELSTELNENSLQNEIKYVMDDLTKGSKDRTTNNLGLVPMVNIIEESSLSDRTAIDHQDDMNSLVASLRTQRIGSGSHSRSKSPLPTPGNLQRSLDNRRDKMIRHNEDILEKLIESNLLPETPPTEEEIEVENMNLLVDSLRTQTSSPNSLRARSPLPSAINIERSIEHRRNKRIQANDELLEKQNSQSSGSQSPVIFNPSFTDEEQVASSPEEEINPLEQSLKVDQIRSRSKSPMRLPSAENLNNSIDSRRHKLIERNDEIQKQFDERTHTPETPNLTTEYVYEFENNAEVSETVEVVQGPAITVDLDDTVEAPYFKVEEENDDCSRESMNLLVQTLRAARSRSRTPIHRRSRSKSPLRIPDEFETEQEATINTPETPNLTVEYVYEFETDKETSSSQIPTIFLESDETDEMKSPQENILDHDDCSRKEMVSLIQSLRVARSRSRSKSPMRLPTADNLNQSLDARRQKLIDRNDELNQLVEERAKTPEPPRIDVEFVYEFESPEKQDTHTRSRFSRSNTPSRSHSLSPSYESSPSFSDYSESNDFHVMLNLEGSHNKTLSKNSEELESLKLYRQRKLDDEALEQLKNASEEIELRTLSPWVLDHDELNEQQSMDSLSDLPLTERSKLLRKSPTTPDYDRTLSEEMQDVERIKQEMLDKRFKRSTYVGESLDIGSEYESLRREAAHFQRSQSPSPSFSRTAIETAQLKAEENRKIQDMILAELAGSSQETSQKRKTGAIPKTERITSTDSEMPDNDIHIDEESGDNSLKYEEMRRRNAEFIRSASRSRSPLEESQLKELVEIEKEAVKRETQDKVLDEISNNSMNFQEFSKYLNPDFLDNDRRASDSALIHKPEMLLQLQDSKYDSCMDMEEPDEYHHYRRFSLAQEQPVEEYPSDDYIFIEEIEVQTRIGSETWVREEFYSEEVNDFLKRQEETVKNNVSEVDQSFNDTEANPEDDQANDDNMEENVQQVDDEDIVEDDEEYSNNSDDDRQTVVEVDDEIDEDISDFKAEESLHETSECEEADREMDRYAGREASDWIDVDNNQEENQGAVGGSIQSPYDSDSFAIDQIYDEAIKNRKQSGILREYDSILMQMSNSEMDEQFSQAKRKPKNVEFNVNFLDNERKDTEMRYLGNAKATERQSVRLRSRYGYNPVLQTNHLDDDSEVDLNYIPKREYNWRKNFKLDEESQTNENETTQQQTEEEQQRDWDESGENSERTSPRKYSQGSESITLFSRSPERTILEEDYADNADNEDVTQDGPSFKEVNLSNEPNEETFIEKPKKKKTKKKSRKESRESFEFVNKDEEDIPDNHIYSRRSSSIQMENDSPKRKSRSRRSSKSSLTNDDSQTLFSPRSSVGYAEPIADIMEEYTETVAETARPKKIKKRKKVKETQMTNVTEKPTENKEEQPMYSVLPISANLTPESSNINILSALSSQNSVCVTPASIDSEMNENGMEEEAEQDVETTILSTASPKEATPSPISSTSSFSRTNSITSPVDTFDILKDANFYPLF